MKGYIYIIRNNVNDKVYIGQTITTVETRWKRHKSAMNSQRYKNIHFYRALRKYGVENFYVETLDVIECSTKAKLKKKLNKLEIHYIESFDSFKNGYNSTKGGDGALGHTPSVEARRKMSKSHKGYKASEKTKKLQSQIRKGRKMTPEAKRKLSKSKKGIIPSQEHIRKSALGHKGLKMKQHVKEILHQSQIVTILQYSLDGEFIKEWPSIKEASIAVGLKSPSSIRQCLSGKSKQSAGFVWKYKNQNVPKHKKFKRAVLQYTLNNKFLKEFESAAEAARNMKITTSSTIINCCKGLFLSAGGFKWKYKDTI